MSQQIIIRNVEKPKRKNVKEDIHWFCDSFGFNSGRDIEEMSYRIVSELIRDFAKEPRISSEQLADDLEVSSARINHHIRNLMDSGFVYRQNRLIFLRGGSVKAAVEEMRKDADRIFDELEQMAEEIDHIVGLRNRD